MKAKGQVCTRCVMDQSVSDLTFDTNGVCSFCTFLDQRTKNRTLATSRTRDLKTVVDPIRAAGRGSKYDCVLGLSGGVDSSYTALVAVRAGLRPLIVHLDNGWNTEAAVHNIECVVRGLKLDLITHVIEWEEFRGLQLSLLRAGVVDLELVSDHAILACGFQQARRAKIQYIVTGDNEATESKLPSGWNHRKTDLANIRSINRAYENVPIRTFPTMSTLELLRNTKLFGIRYADLLTYTDYVKERAMDELESELGWRRYGSKHSESIITRFYQGYILPRKFGIDKRRFHSSLLIHAQQMTREQALAELEEEPYDPRVQAADKIYVCKKFGLTIAEFDQIMSEPPRRHDEFRSDARLVDTIFAANGMLRRLIPQGLRRNAAR